MAADMDDIMAPEPPKRVKVEVKQIDPKGVTGATINSADLDPKYNDANINTSTLNLEHPAKMVIEAFGLKAGTVISEVGLVGTLAFRSDLLVKNVFVMDDPLRVAAIEVTEAGITGSYLIPWHAITYIKH